MRQHLISGLIAAAVATGAAIGVHKFESASSPVAQVTKRTAPSTWEGLEQSEIDALTEALKGIEKHPVAIFCAHGCDDMALDFDNAFESAHWMSGVERPLVDDNVGINVAPMAAEGVPKEMSDAAAALAAAITRATAGRLKPGLIKADIGDRLAVVISRKPR